MRQQCCIRESQLGSAFGGADIQRHGSPRSDNQVTSCQLAGLDCGLTSRLRDGDETGYADSGAGHLTAAKKSRRAFVVRSSLEMNTTSPYRGNKGLMERLPARGYNYLGKSRFKNVVSFANNWVAVLTPPLCRRCFRAQLRLRRQLTEGHHRTQPTSKKAQADLEARHRPSQAELEKLTKEISGPARRRCRPRTRKLVDSQRGRKMVCAGPKEAARGAPPQRIRTI